MTGVRRKKSRKNTTIKITKGLRKKKKLIKPAVGDNILKQHWNDSKTLQQNMKHLGLAYDSNKPTGLTKKKKLTRKDMLKEDLMADAGMKMEVEKEPINTTVIDEFTKQAANGKKTERHISPGEAKFLMDLIHTHSDNYKAMARDKRNKHQHTNKQLQRKCEGLLKSTLLGKYKEMYPGLLPDEEQMES